MRKVYILPNLFTAGSLFCGMLAIFKIFAGDPNQIEEACWLIILSSILDVFDGLVARLTRTQSAFGMELDSLSDVVAFGVAPGLLAFSFLTSLHNGPATAVCGIYVICGALRLARFNVQAAREESKAFLGLPIPGAALALVSLCWLFSDAYFDTEAIRAEWVIPPLTVVLAYLMVSKVPYVGFKSLNLANRQPFEILVIFVVVVAVLYMLKEHLSVVLFSGMWTYITIGVVMSLTRRRRRRRLERMARARIAQSRPENP